MNEPKNKGSYAERFQAGGNLYGVLADSPGKVGRPRAYSVDEFAKVAEEWMALVMTNAVDVSTGKNNTKTGEIIYVTKPEPPLLDGFCRYAGISWDCFNRYMGRDVNFKEYNEIARVIKDFCNTNILRFMFLGIISENVGKFYLVNNSRYVDKTEVLQTITENNKPAWLNKDAGKLPDTMHQLPGESIPYEDVTGQDDGIL